MSLEWQPEPGWQIVPQKRRVAARSITTSTLYVYPSQIPLPVETKWLNLAWKHTVVFSTSANILIDGAQIPRYTHACFFFVLCMLDEPLGSVKKERSETSLSL